jgi:DNA-binding response OmpR family regulator
MPINSKKMIKISVVDSGPGMSKKELSAIFEIFYQSNIGKKNKGSGIGLALTKDLVNLHKGDIKVKSKKLEGTTFTVSLPIDEDSYNDDEKIITDYYVKGLDSDINSSGVILETNNNEEAFIETKKTILIVEDNYDLQALLKSILINDYNILLAENGEEGYSYANRSYPDLILSDIMMPKIDGIEMCKKLQNNKLTKHIPVILLTAKNSTNSKIDGLKSGAIEYINKPFNTNELSIKIKNIFANKEKIISKYRKELITQPKIKHQKTQDETFLEEMMYHINVRLIDSNFRMEELSDLLNVSYSSLYRKCQSLTGYNIVDLVRLMRLKRAAVLMTKYNCNISETAFRNGFNDPKYFSKCFKKQFKKTPKAFKTEAKKEGISSYLNKHQIEDITIELG